MLLVKYLSLKYLSRLFLFSLVLVIYPLEAKVNDRLAIAETIINGKVKNNINIVKDNSQSSSASISVPVTPASTSSVSTSSVSTSSVESNFPNLEDILPEPPIPPLPTITPAKDRVIVKGNFTPQPPLSVGKNIVTSNKMLPFPPALSDPYQPKETTILNAEIENLDNSDRILKVRQNSSNPKPKITSTQQPSRGDRVQYVAPEPISISPFNQTPQDEPNLSNSNNLNSNQRTKTINLSPNSNSSTNSSTNSSANNSTLSSSPENAPSSSNVVQPNYVNSRQKRRTLNDILVFSSGNNNNRNNTDQNTLPTSSSSYKVLVSAKNQLVESQIKSLYPDAFRTQYQGKNFLQVGLFSSQVNAQQVINILRNYGLNPLIIPQN